LVEQETLFLIVCLIKAVKDIVITYIQNVISN